MEITVLGSGQDAGTPQLFCTCTNCQGARANPSLARTAASLRVTHDKTYLIDAIPDLRSQWNTGPPDAIILTHAHMGHIAGLQLLGKEGPNRDIPIIGTPSMAAYLGKDIKQVAAGATLRLEVTIRLHDIKHRAEHTDTVAIELDDGTKRLLYLPDCDSYDDTVQQALAVLQPGDILLFDGTFWSHDELPRMKTVPHPPMQETIPHLQGLAKRGIHVYYTHLNHTNPANQPGPEQDEIHAAGLKIAYDGLKL